MCENDVCMKNKWNLEYEVEYPNQLKKEKNYAKHTNNDSKSLM